MLLGIDVEFAGTVLNREGHIQVLAIRYAQYEVLFETLVTQVSSR